MNKTIITASKQILAANWPNLLFAFFPANSKFKIGNILNEAFDGCSLVALAVDYGGIRSVYSKRVDLVQICTSANWLLPENFKHLSVSESFLIPNISRKLNFVRVY